MMTAVNNDTSKSPSSDHSSQPCTSSLLDFFISNQFCDAQICLVNTSFDGTSRASSLRLNSTTNTVVDQREEDSSSTFSIHRIILASASPVFQIIFNNQSPNRERRLEDRDHQVKTLLPSFTLQGTRGSFNNSNNSTPPILPIYYLDGVKSRDGFYHCLTQIYSSGSAPLTPLNAFSTRAVACRLELMDFVGDIDTFLFKIWENQQLMKEGNPESDSRNSVWLQWAMAAIDDEAPTALLEKLISCATAASETPTLTSSSGSVFQYTKFKFISAVIAEYNKKLTLMSESSASSKKRGLFTGVSL